MRLRIKASFKLKAADIILKPKPQAPMAPPPPEPKQKRTAPPGQKLAPKKKWDPSIEHKKETTVPLPPLELEGKEVRGLVADCILDPISNGYNAFIEIMGYKLSGWGLRPIDAGADLVKKVLEFFNEPDKDEWEVRSSSYLAKTGKFHIQIARKAPKDCERKRCPRCGKNLVETDGRCICTGCGLEDVGE